MFFNQFWSGFGMFYSNKLKETLEKTPNSDLEELFDEENYLQDVKSYKKFSNYLIQHPTELKKLIDYCIQDQQIGDQCDQNKSLKYPFLASETFAQGDLDLLAQFLFGQNPQLSQNNIDIDDSFQNEKEEDEIEEKLDQGFCDNNSNNDGKEAAKKEEEEGSADKEVAQEVKEEKSDEKKEEQESTQEKTETKDEETEQTQDETKKEEEPTEAKWEGTQFLDHIFKFLEKDYKEEHFCTSAGYFSKIIKFLIKSDQLFWKYLSKNPQIIENILKHIDNKSISDVVFKMIVPESNENRSYDYDDESLNNSDNEKTSSDNFQDKRKSVLDQLMVIFEQTDDTEKIENISNIFQCDNALSQQVMESKVRNIYKRVGKYLLETKNLEILFNKLNSTTDKQIQLLTAQVINSLVMLADQLSKCDKDKDDDQVQCDESNSGSIYLEAFATKVPQLFEILCKEPETPTTQQTQFGATIIQWNLGRTKIVEIFANLIKSKNLEALQAIMKTDFYKQVFQYMIQYDWNSFLHIQVSKVFEFTLKTENSELIKTMLTQVDMIKFLLNGYEFDTDKNQNPQNQVQLPQLKTKVNQGRVGFINKFASIIVNHIKQQKEDDVDRESDAVLDYFTDSAEWNKFYENSLKFTLELENERKLGGESDINNDDDYQNSGSDPLSTIMRKLIDHFKPSMQNNDNDEDNDDEDKKHQKDDSDDYENQNELEEDDDNDEKEQIPSEPIKVAEETNFQPTANNWVEQTMKEIQAEDAFNSSAFWGIQSKSNEKQIDVLLKDL